MAKLDPKAEVVEATVYNSNFEWEPPILKELDYAFLKRRYSLEGTILFLVCGVSTVGKDTLLREALKRIGGVHVIPVPRATSRPPRAGEENGIDYFFNLDNVVLWSQYGGNYYAITEEVLQRLKDVKYGVMIQGLVYLKPLKYLIGKLGGKVKAVYILPERIGVGVARMMKLIRERLPVRHAKVMKLRLPSIKMELSYVLPHVSRLRREGVEFVENLPSKSGYSTAVVRRLIVWMENRSV